VIAGILGKWARLVSNQRPLACEARPEEAEEAAQIRIGMRFERSLGQSRDHH
jgi:hypothetical protein